MTSSLDKCNRAGDKCKFTTFKFRIGLRIDFGFYFTGFAIFVAFIRIFINWSLLKEHTFPLLLTVDNKLTLTKFRLPEGICVRKIKTNG